MAYDVEQLCKVYVKMRDARAAMKKDYELRDAKLKEQQETINSALLEICKSLNVESLKTSVGTAFKAIQTRFWVQDWAAVEQFILDNDAFELMEKRIAQNAMKHWVEDYPENLPPSMNVDSKYKIVIRRT